MEQSGSKKSVFTIEHILGWTETRYRNSDKSNVEAANREEIFLADDHESNSSDFIIHDGHHSETPSVSNPNPSPALSIDVLHNHLTTFSADESQPHSFKIGLDYSSYLGYLAGLKPTFQQGKVPTRRHRRPGVDRKPRQAYSIRQLEILETEFKADKYLSVTKRMELSKNLGLTEVQIKTWFQNRRTKWKKQITSHFKVTQPSATFPALFSPNNSLLNLNAFAPPFSCFDWQPSAANLLNSVAWRNLQDSDHTRNTTGSASILDGLIHLPPKQDEQGSLIRPISRHSSSSSSNSSSTESLLLTKDHLVI